MSASFGALLISTNKGKRCIVANIQPAKRLHPHLFRHSIAVLLRGGADVKHVQSFLGHSDIETTRRYLRVVPGFLAEVYHKHMPEIAVRVAGMEAPWPG